MHPYENIPKPLSIPRDFLLRRVHSLTGFFLILFLCEHLLTNSQAALWIGDDGSGFVRAVQFLQSLPHLHVIEICLLGMPFLIHGLLGLVYVKETKLNSFSTDGSSPSLEHFGRNQAFSWQRITALILFVGVILHVLWMRFLDQPTRVNTRDAEHAWILTLQHDSGLDTLSKRLKVTVYDESLLHGERDSLEHERQSAFPEALEQRLSVLKKEVIPEGSVLVECPSFGKAILLLVRETFKSVFLSCLYTIFVLSACFHAANGFWTFFIRWGITLNENSRRCVRLVSNGLLALLAFWGISSIWCTYWITLYR